MVIKAPDLSPLEEEESLSGSFCFTSDSDRYNEWMRRSSDSGCQCHTCDTSHPDDGSDCDVTENRCLSSASAIARSESGISSSTTATTQQQPQQQQQQQHHHHKERGRRLGARSPITDWLSQVRQWTEVESLSALQAKSVAVTQESFEALSVRNAQVAIRRTRTHCLTILSSIEDLISRIPLTIDDLSDFKRAVHCVTLSIHSLVDHCRRRGCDHAATSTSKNTGNSSCDVALHGVTICKFLDDFSRRRNVNNAQLECSLRKMHQSVCDLTETTIGTDVDIIRSALRFTWDSICTKWSLLAMWQLSQKDDFVSAIFLSDAWTVRRLMSLANVRHPQVSEQLSASALRILSHMCPVADCVTQILSQGPGNDLLTILSFHKSEVVLSEAVALVLQITMPLIDCKNSKRKNNSSRKEADLSLEDQSLSHLIQVMPIAPLVKALTSLSRVCHSDHLLHLICSSLANISFLDPQSLVLQETCSTLMSTIGSRFSRSADLCLKDQVVTILANVSSVSPLAVVSSGGLVFLLSCLEMKPENSSPKSPEDEENVSPEDEEKESAERGVALERLQQKVCAAVARLAANKSCAQLLLRLNAVRRIADMCQDARQRNFSDTVLLAGLAALRRIAATTGIQAFRQRKCDHLVVHSLKQTFHMCQNMGDTYV